MKFSESQPRILYAEDNADSRDLVSMICHMSGIEAITADCVTKAWETAQTQAFDLYLLDIRFRDGDGLELCRRLRSFAPNTPIIIYSCNAYEVDKKRGFAAGASDYLTKPFMGDLAATIRQNIEQINKPGQQSEMIYH